MARSASGSATSCGLHLACATGTAHLTSAPCCIPPFPTAKSPGRKRFPSSSTNWLDRSADHDCCECAVPPHDACSAATTRVTDCLRSPGSRLVDLPVAGIDAACALEQRGHSCRTDRALSIEQRRCSNRYAAVLSTVNRG